jgi:uncharacterized protein
MLRDVSRLPTRTYVWTAWTVAALLVLPFGNELVFTAIVGASALIIAALPGSLPQRGARRADRRDLLAIAALYLSVVVLFRLAFVGFGLDHVLGLFLSFAAALLLGVAGPVVYTVWVRHRSLATLGLRVDNWRPAVTLAVLLGGVQFALTLWGYDLPRPVEWVPLLVMSMMVGIYESVFFRGFVQNRLEEQFGSVAGIGGAAVLYGAYHVGYGMGGREILFLTGLGIIYAVAFALVRNLLVLWPLLTPLGSFYANVEAGDIDLPWASIAGFADVIGLMALVIWLAHRHIRRHAPERPHTAAP